LISKTLSHGSRVCALRRELMAVMATDTPRSDEQASGPTFESPRSRPFAMSYGCPRCRHPEADIIGSSVVLPLLVTRCPACGFISSHSVV